MARRVAKTTLGPLAISYHSAGGVFRALMGDAGFISSTVGASCALISREEPPHVLNTQRPQTTIPLTQEALTAIRNHPSTVRPKLALSPNPESLNPMP